MSLTINLQTKQEDWRGTLQKWDSQVQSCLILRDRKSKKFLPAHRHYALEAMNRRIANPIIWKETAQTLQEIAKTYIPHPFYKRAFSLRTDLQNLRNASREIIPLSSLPQRILQGIASYCDEPTAGTFSLLTGYLSHSGGKQSKYTYLIHAAGLGRCDVVKVWLKSFNSPTVKKEDRYQAFLLAGKTACSENHCSVLTTLLTHPLYLSYSYNPSPEKQEQADVLLELKKKQKLLPEQEAFLKNYKRQKALQKDFLSLPLEWAKLCCKINRLECLSILWEKIPVGNRRELLKISRKEGATECEAMISSRPVPSRRNGVHGRREDG